MVFQLPVEQEALRDSIRSFLADSCSPERLVQMGTHTTAAQYKELSTAVAGLGLGEYFSSPDSRTGAALSLSLIAFEAGRHLCPYPLYQGAFGCHLLSDPQMATIGISLAPQQHVVEGLDTLKKVVLLQSTGTIHLRHIKACRAYRGLDLSTPRVEIEYLEQPASPVASVGQGLDLWRLLRASELSGIADMVLGRTLEHVKQRVQFGVPIGSFQSVQHALADAQVETAALSALVRFAAWAAESSTAQFSLAVTSALRHACEKVPAVVEMAVQLHGGIGFTWESVLHLYLRRALALRAEAQSLVQNDELIRLSNLRRN